MFREMRRNKQELSKEDSIKILENNNTGTLALLGDNDYPYSLPINYVYDDNKIYIHCALEGHKIDAISKHNKVSFSVVKMDEVLSEKYTTLYQSVIIFGKAKILENVDEKKVNLLKLTNKYHCDPKGSIKEIELNLNRFVIIEIDIEYLSGKQSIELIK